MERKYQVFISSTYEDLKTERQAAISCLLDMNCIPVGMEQFPASSLSQLSIPGGFTPLFRRLETIVPI